MWQTSRFECKYMIPAHRLDSVRQWVRMFLKPDRYAANNPGLVYTVSSLYLDSADFQLHRMTEAGIKNRFKLRIRGYSDSPDSPRYLEIKRRIDRTIRKSRVAVGQHEIQMLMNGRKHAPDLVGGEDLHHIDAFIGLMRRVAAHPVVRVRYRREAYESTANDRVRITFDDALCFAATPHFDFSVNAGLWRRVPMDGVLLEVKFTEYFPQWAAEMIRSFELQRIPFSKYGFCVKGMMKPVNRAFNIAGCWLA